jgi:hypothetical protein
MTDKIKRIGSKAEVFHSSARQTSGGLKKKDLMKHKGRIISRKKHAAGKKALKFLTRQGYIAKKGKFVLMRKSMAHPKKSRSKSSKRRSTRKRGGFWFEEAKAPSVSDMMKGAMGSVSTAAAGPYGKK